MSDSVVLDQSVAKKHTLSSLFQLHRASGSRMQALLTERNKKRDLPLSTCCRHRARGAVPQWLCPEDYLSGLLSLPLLDFLAWAFSMPQNLHCLNRKEVDLLLSLIQILPRFFNMNSISQGPDRETHTMTVIKSQIYCRNQTLKNCRRS